MGALAVAQPVLDVFGRAPDVFVFRNAGAADICLFALLVTLGPPLVLWVLSAPWRLGGATARRRAHLVACGLLVAAIAVLFARDLLSLDGLLLGLAVAAAVAGFVWAYRKPLVRSWLAFLALAAPVFVVLFLVASPTSALLDESEPSSVAAAPTSDNATRSGPPVVILLLDELPLRSLLDTDGTIDRGLYPNLAALADDSVFYRNATTVAGATWHAVPSMLTGQNPVEYEAPTSVDHPDSLFTAFDPEYEIEGFETLTRLCPTSICEPTDIEGVPSGVLPLLADSWEIYGELLVPSRRAADPVTSYLEATEATEATDDADPGFDDFEVNQPARYAAFLDRLHPPGPSSPPTFAYLHLLLPHEPWRFYPSGVEYEAGDDEVGRFALNWAGASPAVDVARQRHLLQAAYADRLVGGVIDQLKANGTYQDAVVVVTSDHGVAFRPGEPVRGTAVEAEVDPVLAELMWVPLLIKAPALAAGTVDDQNVEIIDLAPTVADLAGIELGYEVDGRSLVSDEPRTTDDKTFWPVEMSQFGNLLGPRYTIDGRDGLAATLSDGVGRFLPDHRDIDLRPYRLGSYGWMVGERVDALAGAALADDRVSDDRVILDLGVDLVEQRAADVVAGLLSGRLTSGDSDTTVAVAANGRVAGVTETFDYGEPGSFVVLVAESLLRLGGNDVSFYRVDGPPDDPVLTPLALEG